MIPRFEILVRIFTKFLPPNNERPKTLSRHIRAFFIKPIVPHDYTRHDDIGTFLEEENFTSLVVSDDYTHSFGFGGEGEYIEDCEI